MDGTRLGLAGFVNEPGGVGGVLKTRTADFRVEEVGHPPSLDPNGRFTVIRATLDNWETNRFVNKVSGILRMSRNRIWFSGTKDKRAITRQLFVVDAPVKKVQTVELPDVDIEVLGRTHQRLSLGDHTGNRFTIVVRGCADTDGNPLSEEAALAEVETLHAQLVERLGPSTFPNWIGPQRFGSGRAITALVGLHVVNGDFEAAVRDYVGFPGPTEDEKVRAFRTAFREGEDLEAVRALAPDRLGFERKMVEHLIKHEDDWVGAYRTLPNNLQLMTVHALQSIAFNTVLAERLAGGLPLTTPLEGDVVGHLDERGQLDTGHLIRVEADQLERVARNCRKRRLAVTGPLPGRDHLRATGAPGEVETSVEADMGLAEQDWTVSAIPRLTSGGTRRALVSHYDAFEVDAVPPLPPTQLSERWQRGPQESDRWHPDGACLRLRFTLPPGAYATTLMREFMHAPLHQY